MSYSSRQTLHIADRDKRDSDTSRARGGKKEINNDTKIEKRAAEEREKERERECVCVGLII